MRGSPRWAITVLPAFLVFGFHAALFRDWLIDDAGISFSYARSLAMGHGLVAQPGVPPVEGYSNPLWVFLLSPAFLFRIFDPVWTSKLVAGGLVLACLWALDRSLIRLGLGRLAGCCVLLLVTLQTSFVLWAISGLENALYAALIALLLLVVLRDREVGTARNAALAGALAAGIALTRPEGAIFAVMFPAFAAGVRPARAALRRMLSYGGVFAAIFGGYLVFRLQYFGGLVPNTYHAKEQGTFAEIVARITGPATGAKAGELMNAAAGATGGPLVLLLLLGTVALILGRRLARGHAVLLGFLVMASLDYLLLPADWMPEFRFATPFFPLFYASLAAIGSRFTSSSSAPLASAFRSLAPVAALVLLGLVGASSAGRSVRFASDPLVPFADVVREVGLRFNAYADSLGVTQGSVLTPDVGGTLYVSRLRVDDMAGLCDPVVARTIQRDQAAFHDHVFERLKPTFVEFHAYWTLASCLELDPRFRRDYLPLHEFRDPWVKRRNPALVSGEYVRKEVAALRPAAVRAIQNTPLEDLPRRLGR
jgi:hypothetical protein